MDLQGVSKWRGGKNFSKLSAPLVRSAESDGAVPKFHYFKAPGRVESAGFLRKMNQLPVTASWKPQRPHPPSSKNEYCLAAGVANRSTFCEV
jgi:hypothetical protein